MEWWQILLIILGGLLVLFLLSIVLYKQFFKRFWDIVLSGLAIIVFSPLLLILTIIGLFVMKGNPFFTQKRPGKKRKNGQERIFKLIKFRSMTNEKDENGELLSDEKRLKKYGKILRSTSLDELPELFNIFIGNMSIVGPRPLVVSYLPYYSEEERRRHDVRPGLTGLAQINGRTAIDWDKKLEYDQKYVCNITLFGDMGILFRTIAKVLKHSDVATPMEQVDFDIYRKNQYLEGNNCGKK